MKNFSIIRNESDTIPTHKNIRLPRIISFREWLLAHHECDYLSYLMNGIYTGEIQSSLCTPTDIISVVADITSLRFYRRSENSVFVDAILKADIDHYVHEFGRTFEVSDSEHFRIRGYYDLEGNDTNLFSETTIYSPTDDLNHPFLNDYLYKKLKSNKLEDEAYRILETYYSGDYMNGESISPYVLAENLDLEVTSGITDNTGGILGRLYIQRGADRTMVSGQMAFFEVPKRSIVVDKLTENSNRSYNTIIHECVHYVRHGLFILLQEMYREEVRKNYPDINLDDIVLTAHEQQIIKEIEWQADRLAPRIQMPEFSVRPLIEESLSEFRHLNKTARIVKTIRRISNHFNVSLQAARFRLCELGYTDASGVLNYIAGKRVPDYNITGIIEPYQTYTVEQNAIERLCNTNKTFNIYIISRRLIYVEGHVCINHPAYVDSNTNRLTDYARNNIDKCCVLFTLHKRVTFSYKSGTLQRSDEDGFIEIEYSEQQILQMFAEADKSNDLLNNDKLSDQFSVSLREHMKRTGTTIERLSEISFISEDKIKKLRNSEGYKVTVEEIMAMGIAMHLYPALIYDLMEKAGVSLRRSKRHNYYRTIIDRMYGATIEQCNKALELKGMEPFINTDIYK